MRRPRGISISMNELDSMGRPKTDAVTATIWFAAAMLTLSSIVAARGLWLFLGLE
jgi:hypothetical protein